MVLNINTSVDIAKLEKVESSCRSQMHPRYSELEISIHSLHMMTYLPWD